MKNKSPLKTSEFIYASFFSVMGVTGFAKFFPIIFTAISRGEMESLVYTFKNAVFSGYPAFTLYVLWFLACCLFLGAGMSYFWRLLVEPQ